MDDMKSKGRAASKKKGKTKYDRIVDGQGVLNCKCDECGGDTYYIPKNQLEPYKTGKKFCGKRCTALFVNRLKLKDRGTVNCLSCKKSIIVVLGKSLPKKYCSRDCYLKRREAKT